MRKFWLEYKTLTETQKLDLMSYNTFFTDVTGLGEKYELDGATNGGQYILAARTKAADVISGTMIFSAKRYYNDFVTFCDTENGIIVFCMQDPGDDQTLRREVTLATCERTEAKANGSLECPTTLQALTDWYIEAVETYEDYEAQEGNFEGTTIDPSKLISLGAQEAEVSLQIEPMIAGTAGVSWMIPEIGIVEYDAHGEELSRTLKISCPSVFAKGDTFELISNPQSLAVRAVPEMTGANLPSDRDLYWEIDQIQATPFIRTTPGVTTYLYISAITESTAQTIPLGVTVIRRIDTHA